MSKIPALPEHLSTGWLTATMRAAATLGPDQRVTGFDLSPLGAGLGLSGETIRIALTYNEADAGPATVIGKFAAASPVMKAIVEANDAYAREIAFYRDLSKEVPLRCPTYFGGAYDPPKGQKAREKAMGLFARLPDKMQVAATARAESGLKPSRRNYGLLIEDLGPGHELFPMQTPPSFEQLSLVLDRLADLHAHFWGRQTLVESPAVRPIGTIPGRTMRAGYFGRDRGLARTRWDRDIVSDDAFEQLDDAVIHLEQHGKRLNRGLTLLHGDARSDNVLFDEHGDVAFLDWAMPAYAHPGWDVGYLLGASLDSERSDEAPELMRSYVAKLAGLGTTMPFDDLWETARSGWFWMSCALINGLHMTMMPSLDGTTRTEDIWVPRMAALLAMKP